MHIFSEISHSVLAASAVKCIVSRFVDIHMPAVACCVSSSLQDQIGGWLRATPEWPGRGCSFFQERIVLAVESHQACARPVRSRIYEFRCPMSLASMAVHVRRER